MDKETLAKFHRALNAMAELSKHLRKHHDNKRHGVSKAWDQLYLTMQQPESEPEPMVKLP